MNIFGLVVPDVLLIMVGIFTITFSVVGFYVFYQSEWFHQWRRHSKVYLLTAYGVTQRVHRILWLNQDFKKFEFKDANKNKRAYIVNLNKAIFSSRGNPILFYDINRPEPINLNPQSTVKGSSQELSDVLNDNSTADVLAEGSANKIMIVVALFSIALIAVGLVSMFLLNQQNGEILKLSTKLAGIIANQTNTGGIIIR